jgi:26S proteasome regulatory subunit N1
MIWKLVLVAMWLFADGCTGFGGILLIFKGNGSRTDTQLPMALDCVARECTREYAGFQTHDTPVLLATSDRAELATEKHIAVSPLLEGVVIVRKNPAYVEGAD